MPVSIYYVGGGLLCMVLVGAAAYIGQRLERWRQGAAGAVGTLIVLLWLVGGLITGLAGYAPSHPERACIGPPSESC